MEANQCAVRRIPCLCKNFKTQLEFGSKWDRKEKDAKKQRMFLKLEKGDCYFASIMGALASAFIYAIYDGCDFLGRKLPFGPINGPKEVEATKKKKN